MSALADRLRGIVASVPHHGRRGGPSSFDKAQADPGGPPGSLCWHSGDDPAGDPAADILGGSWHETRAGRCLVIDRTYRPGHRHGRLTMLDHVLPDGDRWRQVLVGPVAAAAAPEADGRPRRALFIDLETTGLAGGAGTYAFLVGLGWFEACTFRVRQLFLSDFTAERVLLDVVAALAASAHLVVSYNGKSFDLPLMDTRFVMHRRPTPFAEMPHLDMLHHARRLWRTEEDAGGASTCRLTALERAVCGHVREGDVAGVEIPARYFHYVHTGNPRPLEGVLEHNRMDLLSLAFLTARAAQLAEDGAAHVTTAREALGLGRLYERAALPGEARACYARASGMDGAAPLPACGATRAEALHAYAALCRRTRRHADAAVAWQALATAPGCPPAALREAAEALAVHHEHRLRDPRSARAFALTSLPLQATAARRHALQHRVARLDRKLGGQGLF